MLLLEIFSRNLQKIAQISTYTPKTEFKRFFPTPGDYIFVQNSISYKKFPSKISYKNALISTCSPKTGRNVPPVRPIRKVFSNPGW